MRTLERLGLAEAARPARWVLAADVEQRLWELGERGGIINRLHKSLTKDGATRARTSAAEEQRCARGEVTAAMVHSSMHVALWQPNIAMPAEVENCRFSSKVL